MGTEKSQLIEQLQAVFIARGYDGATLVHLASATGLSKASLYHHFPGGKPEMAAVLVRHAIADLHRLAFSCLTGRKDPAQAVQRFIDGFAAYTQRGESDCFLAVISHHSTAHAEITPLQHQIAEQFADWHASLTATFEALGDKPKRAQRRAHDLISRLYGALMNAKMHNQPRLFDKAIQRLLKDTRRELEPHIPAPE